MILLSTLGCVLREIDQSYVSQAYVTSRWLSSLQNGKTTRTEVVSFLGQPTEEYANNRILVYRLILSDQNEVPTLEDYRTAMSRWSGARQRDPIIRNPRVAEINERRSRLAESGRLLVITKENAAERFWYLIVREAEFSLVCVLDDQQRLRTHRLIEIKP